MKFELMDEIALEIFLPVTAQEISVSEDYVLQEFYGNSDKGT